MHHMNRLSTNNWIVIGIGTALLLFGAWWLMTSSAAPSSETNTEKSGALDAEEASINLNTVVSTTSDSESVTVADQVASDTITVASVSFTQSGWVAVRDDRGWTLGAGRFEKGTQTNVTVQLLRTTSAGERYQALLYIDDGDGEFDLEKEILVTRSDGSIAGTTFKAN